MRHNQHTWFGTEMRVDRVATRRSRVRRIRLERAVEDGLGYSMRSIIRAPGPDGGEHGMLKVPEGYETPWVPGGNNTTVRMRRDATVAHLRDAIKPHASAKWDICAGLSALAGDALLAEVLPGSNNVLYVKVRPSAMVEYYTDGSTPVAVGGFAAVRATVAGNPGRVIVGVCQNTGNNYPVECSGVLAALLDAEVTEVVCVNEDCLANVQALYRGSDWTDNGEANIPVGMLTHRQRIRSGARAINNTIRKVIKMRYRYGASSRARYVRAHTGAMDVRSRMNDKADGWAKAARINRMERYPPFTLNDELVLYYTSEGERCTPVYVSGDLRRTLKRMVRDGQRRAVGRPGWRCRWIMLAAPDLRGGSLDLPTLRILCPMARN